MVMDAHMQKRVGPMMKDASAVEDELVTKDHGPSSMKDHGPVMRSFMSTTHDKLKQDMMPASTKSEIPKVAKGNMMDRFMTHPDPSEMASGPKDHASATLPNNCKLSFVCEA